MLKLVLPGLLLATLDLDSYRKYLKYFIFAEKIKQIVLSDRWWLQTRESLKDCTSHCSSYKVESNPERWQHNKGETDALLFISIFLYACESWLQS